MFATLDGWMSLARELARGGDGPSELLIQVLRYERQNRVLCRPVSSSRRAGSTRARTRRPDFIPDISHKRLAVLIDLVGGKRAVHVDAPADAGDARRGIWPRLGSLLLRRLLLLGALPEEATSGAAGLAAFCAHFGANGLCDNAVGGADSAQAELGVDIVVKLIVGVGLLRPLEEGHGGKE